MNTNIGNRILIIGILIIMPFNLQACKTNDTNETNNQSANETASNSESRFDSSKAITENMDILNSILETKYGKSLSLSTKEEYENTGQADWTLILEDDKVGIDTATWKFSYNSDSDESMYMDAILITFIFFYGEEMGNSLWLLTGDLLDGGADESLYGFKHVGGQAIYKDGNTATYELGNNDNFYIWLTPSGL